jgi:hypothetical protein
MLQIQVDSKLYSKTGRCIPNDLAVDSAGDAVLQLQVHLRDGIVGENGGVRDITCSRSRVSGVVHQSSYSTTPSSCVQLWQSRPGDAIRPIQFRIISTAHYGRGFNCMGFDKGSNVRMAADSTMLRMVNLLIALSLGVQRAQLEQRTGLTWPRPFLLRPL